ncbi:acyl--CoA ligase [Natronomonas gomsonensis]|uniref:class I adenylate-forming enzyme family protein n=1 Tax=Natronomonas gomsonensis TaxID=1046043 RepID=UPI0020CA6C63|nr:class I adenylate-forming enzyme family protein [Natronomonas gomsonensis]MCY4728988.1 acyl--CoA ligase [Natronomonas gomsonensis]
MNFATHVDAIARSAPDRLAMTNHTREVTYAELAGETNAFANALESLDVEAGDRVALYLPNSIGFMTAYLGAMKRGAIPFPINMRFQGEEIQYVLEDSGAVAAVTHGQFEDVLAGLDVPSLEHLVVADGEKGHSYRELVGTADTDYDAYPRKEDELAELMYTSGTTGRPKGVKHTHRNLGTNARGLVEAMGWSKDTTTLTVCPLFHVSGLNVSTTPLLTVGAENHFLPEWDPDAALATMAEHDATYAFFIPTMVIDLLERDVSDHDLSSLELIGVGGSPMPKERIETVEETFGVTLLEGYGMTETTPLAAINRPGQDVRKAGSIGPPATEVVDVRIENPETGEAADTDEKGELLWHGDTVTPGYFRMPEKNEEAFVQREGKRWLRSGDIARMDEDGHLFVEDRIDDMIITGGENVYPREIEDVIYELDGVVEVAVIGTPHDRLGETVTAVVVGDGLSADDVEQHCRGRLTDYKIPRRIEFVEELPKTSTRKIDKVSLRDDF